MNYQSLLAIPPQISVMDRPRTGPTVSPSRPPRTALAHALGQLGATHYLPEDRQASGPCARCGALITRYGPTCTSSLCVACNVLRWVQP